jgi:hypothetical protein
MMRWIALLLLALALTGCGAQTTTEAETEPEPASAAPVTHHHPTPTVFGIHCDQNITVASSTSCGLADNVFREFARELAASESTSSLSAFSPTTGKRYELDCVTSDGVVCTGGVDIKIAFPLWAARAYSPPSEASEQPAPEEPPSEESSEEGEEPAESGGESGFCSEHTCIPNYPNGRGYPVECADGEWSKSGGIQGACSGHGGERR